MSKVTVLLVALAACLLASSVSGRFLTKQELDATRPSGPTKGMPNPPPPQIIKATQKSAVYIKVKKTDAAYLHEVYICNPTYPHDLVQPHTTYNKDYPRSGVFPENTPSPAGWPVADYSGLRAFTAGQEVVPCTEHLYYLGGTGDNEFGAGEVFKTGPGYRNSDGVVHAKIVLAESDPNPITVNGQLQYSYLTIKFEDRYAAQDDKPEDPAHPKDFDDIIIRIYAYDYDDAKANYKNPTKPVKGFTVLTVADNYEKP